MAPEQVIGRRRWTRAPTSSRRASCCTRRSRAGPPSSARTAVEVLSATLHEEPPALAGRRRGRRLRSRDPPRARQAPGATATRAAAEMLARARGDRARRGLPAPGARSPAPLTRLAVLPFRLLRPDPEIDFLRFALADAVSASLAGLPGVVMRSSAAVARFAERGAGPEGARQPGGRGPRRSPARCCARATSSASRRSSWRRRPGRWSASQTLQSAIGDVFRLQDELARGSSRRSRPRSPRREATGAPRGARERARLRVLPARERGRPRLDAGRGRARPLPPVRRRGPRLRAGVGQARPLPPPARASTTSRTARENLARADECFRRALELDPELPVAHKLYAHHQAEMGRARDAMARARLARARAAATTPRPSRGSSTPAATAGCSKPRRPHTARRGGSTRTSGRASSTRGGPAATFEPIVAETSDAGDFQLRSMALEGLGRRAEAIRSLEEAPKSLTPVFRRDPDGAARALSGNAGRDRRLDRRRGHAHGPGGVLHVRDGPGALRRPRARLPAPRDGLRARLQRARALRDHPWLASLRASPAFSALVERAEADAGSRSRPTATPEARRCSARSPRSRRTALPAAPRRRADSGHGPCGGRASAPAGAVPAAVPAPARTGAGSGSASPRGCPGRPR